MALPTGVASLDEADAAVELWEHYSGKRLDDGQRLDVAVMLATRADGLWAASVTGHEKPRQSGKGDSIEVVELWGLTQRSERILHTIHDAVLLATETQARMLALLELPDLRRLKAREWKGTGQQMIEMRNGGIVWYRTRTGAGGRGLDAIDRVVVDEAQHAELQHLAAITPTQAASVNPQLNALGTGALEGKSSWWWSLRKEAKASRVAWVGWSAQPWTVNSEGRVTLGDVDPTNRDLWWSTIPGLVAGRVSIDFLERELRVLGPVGFAQEYLCVWAAEPDSLGGPIPIDQWMRPPLHDEHSKLEPATMRLALDAPPERTTATLSAASRRDGGLVHVEQFWHFHPGGMRDLVQVVKQATIDHGVSLTLPPGSPAKAWKAELEAAGVPLDEMTPAEYAEACGYITSAVTEGTLRHRGQAEMNNAVSGLAVKSSGDVDIFARRSSSANIAPFVAATCALYRVPEQAAYTGSYFTDLDALEDDDWED